MKIEVGQLVWLPFIKGRQPARILEVGADFVRVRKFRIATGKWTKTILKIEPDEILGMYDGPTLIERLEREAIYEYRARRSRERKIAKVLEKKK